MSEGYRVLVLYGSVGAASLVAAVVGRRTNVFVVCPAVLYCTVLYGAAALDCMVVFWPAAARLVPAVARYSALFFVGAATSDHDIIPV